MLRAVNEPCQERRLRPIYDSLDSGNFRKALQESDRLLKKQPDYLVAKALKALSCVRLGRHNEARALIMEISCSEVIDHLTIQALTYCHRELGEPEKLVRLYENVSKLHPTNEDFLFQLAISYSRVGEYKMQSQTSMHLYKLRPQPLYYFWTVMGYVLQADVEPEMAQTVHLPLASKMTEKHFETNPNDVTSRQVQLYLYILKRQKRWADILTFMDGEIFRNTLASSQATHADRLCAFKRLHRFQEAWDASAQYISDWPIDMAMWVEMIEITVAVAKQGGSGKTEMIKATAAFMNAQVLTALKTEEGAKRSRTQQLCRIRLVCRLLKEGILTAPELMEMELGEPVDLIALYFEYFGAKACVVRDLDEFLPVLKEYERTELVNKLTALADYLPVMPVPLDEDVVFAESGDVAVRHANVMQICCMIDWYKDMTIDSRLVFVHQCLQRYLKARPPVEEHFVRNDRVLAADSYLMLCIVHLWEVFIKNDDELMLHRILTLLIEGISFDKTNAVFRVMLIKVYSVLGSASRIGDAFNSLEAKYILLDCLWYLLADQLSSFGFYRQHIVYTTGCVEFYMNTVRETVDCYLLALKSASFMKAIETSKLRTDLRRSANQQICRVDQVFYKLIMECKTFDEVRNMLRRMMEPGGVLKDAEDIDWEKLVDSRDFSLVPYLVGDQMKSDINDYNQKMYRQLVCKAQYHFWLMRYFKALFLLSWKVASATVPQGKDEKTGEQRPESGSAANGSVSSGEGEVDHWVDEAAKCMETLQALLQTWRQEKPKFDRRYALYGSPPSYFIINLNGSYPDVVLSVGKVCVEFLRQVGCTAANRKQSPQDCATSCSNGQRAIFPNSGEFQQQLRSMFAAHQLKFSASEDFPYMQIVHVSMLVEALMVCVQMCSAIRSLTSPVRCDVTKRCKKKRALPVDSDLLNLFEQFDQYFSVISLACQTVERMINDLHLMLEADISSLRVTDKATNSSNDKCKVLEEDMVAQMKSKIRDSYKLPLDELNTAIGHLRSMISHVSGWREACR